MDRKLTLGSLFDGSGGFPLGAVLTGIEPLWASEIEPFPIRVTTKRLPQMKHYGDINKIDGAAVPPVDIITGGFCCQDLSVAGKRAGLHGERSGLFFQVIRIIKEMLAATGNEYPKFAVLENVPGMYSSNGGLDFQEVLNELIRIKDETLSVPMPEKGKWSTSGEIVGDGFSVGWRTLDAQFWGVAQRRRRCYLVVDFTGGRAGEILFDESRLRGNPPQGGFPRQTAAGGAPACAGSAVCFEPGACSRLGGHVWKGAPVGALRADMGDNQTAVAIENHPADSRVKLCENGIVQTLSERMGTGGGNVPLVMDRNEPKTLKIRSGCEDGGKGAPVQDNLSATLSTSNNQTVFIPKSASFMGGQGADAGSIAYSETVTPTLRGQAGGNSVPMVMTAFGICSQSSNAMLSPNPHSGIYEAETSRTLDLNCARPDCSQGGVAVVAVQGSMIGREDGNGPRGSGVKEGISFTLDTADRHALAYAMTTGEFAQACREKSPCLQARDYKDPPVVGRPDYIVRRLTPTECARLQGFPDWWCSGLGTENPSDEEIAFWSDVWETYRLAAGTIKKAKSRNQILKWLRHPHTDSAEYKMWGNGVALPCVRFVLEGIATVTSSG